MKRTLARIIADIDPNELLQIGQFDLPECAANITSTAYAIPHFTRRYPLAIIQLENKTIDDAILARLRDLVADCVIAIIPNNSLVNESALGFRHLAESSSWKVCSFDISNYKQTPDWLNAKYWANPELWDQYRW